MKKRLLSLLGVVTLLLGSAMTAQAEDYQGEEGWTVSFRGDGLESNFKTADINDAVYNLQPGDSIAITVTLENGGEKPTDWWMTNKVLRSLEDTQEAAYGGSYTYTLCYEDPQGTEQILYTSDTVGGEKEGETGSGLKEATDSLEEYFFLDALAVGERGHIRLTVALDGETQGNSYQDSLADLQMNFAVEETTGPRLVPVEEGNDPSVTPVPGTPDGTQRGTGQPPKTSDESDIFPYVGLALASGIGLLAMALYSLKIRMCAESHKGVQE